MQVAAGREEFHGSGDIDNLLPQNRQINALVESGTRWRLSG